MASGNEVVLREYRVADLNEIVELDESCFAEEFRFDRRSMKAYAETRNAISLVAEKGGRIVGFVIVHLDQNAAGRRGYVVTLDVVAEYRRMGLAAWMMRAAERMALAVGVQQMELHVFTENEVAIRFYERMGYEQVKRLQRFYGAVGLDAFVYRKRY